MKLIIMTKATFFVEEDKILTSLFEEGMESLHLYKPGAEPVYSERLLTLLPEDYYRRITVHDHFYLREEFGLHSIHLNIPHHRTALRLQGTALMHVPQHRRAERGQEALQLRVSEDHLRQP